MNKVEYKMIKVLSNGPIRAKGGIYGPINSVYREKVSTIFLMICDKVQVVEVLNGVEIPLTVSNYDIDNTPAPEVKEVVKEVEKEVINTPTPEVIEVEKEVIKTPEQPKVDLSRTKNKNNKSQNQNKPKQPEIQADVIAE